MGKSLETFLEQLGLLESVFIHENGNRDCSFVSEVQRKIDIIKPDAYYVFDSEPLILFFDLTTQQQQNREKEIHKQVWSFDHSPVVFMVKGEEIKVYNAFNYSKKDERLEELKLSDIERNNRFSFWELQSGFTWKWLQKEYYENRSKNQYRKRVNERLFENIKEVREKLTSSSQKNTLSDNEANSLILRLIFIRYLIDRKVKIDDDFIKGNVENVNKRRESFIALVKQPILLNSLFEKLNNRFNGVLFAESDFILSSEQSIYLSNVFKGELQEEGSLFEAFFFAIFDFSIIPVEVISGIYESLIDEETKELDAAVYTPPFLVEYVLSDTIDAYLEEKNVSECKIFEVAVGSGIFLVQSLRKMIDRELVLNPNLRKKELSERTTQITKNNLFGIDINEEALKVACFSIYIALLDYQDPKDIDSYEFPNLLNENLFQADFFDVNHEYNTLIKEKTPKFILGNPPWKKDKSKNHLAWVNSSSTYSKKITGKLEIAQSFLLRTKDFMNAETKAALIVTSTLFYNVSSTTKEFKADFLKTFCVEKLFDLSPVRRLIFEKKNSPACIVYFNLSTGNNYNDNLVVHQSIKSNHFLRHFQIIVIEKYDQKKILQRLFIENDWMFKLALYGNTLDFHLLKRLYENKDCTVLDLIDDLTVYKGAGIERGKDSKPYPDLIGLPIIENREITQSLFHLKEKRELTEKDINLSRGHNKKIFIGHKLLFKEQNLNESEPLISYTRDDLVFRKGIFSITSTNSELIRILLSYYTSDLSTYYLFLISAAWGVATRPAIRFIDEYLSMPFIEPNKEIKSEILILIEKYLEPLREYYAKEIRSENVPENKIALKKINDIINNIYEIKEYERDLIDYVLKVSRYQFQESKQHLVSDFNYFDESSYRYRNHVLKNYAKIYIDEFQKIYKEEFIQVEIYPLDYFIALNFVFSNVKPKETIIYQSNNESEVLNRLANNLSISQITSSHDSTKNLFIQKDIKGFEENSFYIIKPNEYKCWHRAMAWYDVAEFKEAIEKVEMINLTENVNDT